MSETRKTQKFKIDPITSNISLDSDIESPFTLLDFFRAIFEAEKTLARPRGFLHSKCEPPDCKSSFSEIVKPEIDIKLTVNDVKNLLDNRHG